MDPKTWPFKFEEASDLIIESIGGKDEVFKKIVFKMPVEGPPDLESWRKWREELAEKLKQDFLKVL